MFIARINPETFIVENIEVADEHYLEAVKGTTTDLLVEYDYSNPAVRGLHYDPKTGEFEQPKPDEPVVDMNVKPFPEETLTIADKRLEVCQSCPQRTDEWTCKACGCFIKALVRLPHGKCPEGRWSE